MIEAPVFFVVCPAEGAYLSRNKRFWVRPFNSRNPGGYTPKSIGLFGPAEADTIVKMPPVAEQRPKGALQIIRALRCACCGKHQFQADVLNTGDGHHIRCAAHADRNPCAIEGCERTTSVPDGGKLRSDQWLCPVHWRRYVPPRSARRRAYNAYFRIAKRHGWTPKLRRRFWRYWGTLIRSARSRGDSGFVDEDAVKKLFGWD